MKITELQIERFGVWNDLHLRFDDASLSVIYGPNEAGKTTLLRFIRGVLYGFKHDAVGPTGIEPARVRGPWKGILGIEQYGEHYQIHRVSQPHSRGFITIQGNHSERTHEELLREWLCGLDETLFEHIYAIGLHELHLLTTLQDEEVAQQLFGTSLGPEGRQLLAVGERLRAVQGQLCDGESGQGTLLKAWEQFAQLDAELQRIGDCRQQYTDLAARREHLDRKIENMKGRQVGLKEQERGHRFLELVWKPWNKVYELEEELADIPDVDGFPENGLVQLRQIEQELQTARSNRRRLREELDELRNELGECKTDDTIRTHVFTVRTLCMLRPWIAETETQLTEDRGQLASVESRLRELQAAGDQRRQPWEQPVDVSDNARWKLSEAADRYRTAVSRWKRAKRRYRHLAAACQQRMQESAEELRQARIESLDDALAAAYQHRSDLHELSAFRQQERDLNQHVARLRRQLDQLEETLELPGWITPVLATFGVTGLLLVVGGIVVGVLASALVGAVYALAGFTCLGIMGGLKKSVRGQFDDSLEELTDELQLHEMQLRETRQQMSRKLQQIRRACGVESSATSIQHSAGDVTKDPELLDEEIAALTALLEARIERLEDLLTGDREIQRRRRQLSSMRQSFPPKQKSVVLARQQWCAALREAGLPETVRVNEALDVWRRLANFGELQQRYDALSAEIERRSRPLRHFHQTVETLRQELSPHATGASLLQLLDDWELRLVEFDEHTTRRRELIRELRQRQRAIRRCQRTYEKLKWKQSALLIAGGAESVEDFEQRHYWAELKQELTEELDAARRELAEVGQTEPHLALVEDDLLAFNAQKNADCLEVLNQELADLDRDLQAALVELGEVGGELERLRSDERPSQLLFEREQAAYRLKQEAEKLLAVQWTARLLGDVRQQFQREEQPEVLASASRFLERLTEGRHRHIWAPLGEQRLCVDDERGNSFHVEQLSNGAREQLFLAVRLALVEHFTARGVKLPLVLDDVIVNFDRQRTDSALGVLTDFAARGQQIVLLTCHSHIADELQHRGIMPIRLPAHDLTQQERQAG